jgi:hypothetical protein
MKMQICKERGETIEHTLGLINMDRPIKTWENLHTLGNWRKSTG